MATINTGNGSGLIQALGVGSGLDIQSLVTQLVQAEGAPVQSRLTRHASTIATQLSAVGTLRGALSSFQSALAPLKAAQFDVLKATSADNDIYTATADSDAVAGSYDIEVRQLAQSDRLVSTPFAGGATTSIGTGTLTISLGTANFAVDIVAGATTLADVRDAINAASGNPGVQATLVYGQDGARLVLSSTQTGASNTLRVAASGGDGGLAQLSYDGTPGVHYTVNQAAQDAIVVIAGVEKHSTSNVVSDAIDGVALTLHAADPGSTTALTVSADRDAVTANLRKFVDAYNTLRTRLNSLSYYDAASKTAGPMLGDSLFSGIDTQLRQLTTSQVSGASSYGSLASIGITTDATGKLVIDSAKLQAALSGSRGAVAQLFGSSNGIATRLDAMLDRQLGADGSIAARDKSLQSSQKSLDAEQQRLSTRLAAVQQRYLAQFTALDTLMSQLNKTSSFLTQQLASSSSIASSSSS